MLARMLSCMRAYVCGVCGVCGYLGSSISVHDIFYSGVCFLFSFSLSVHLFVSVSLFPNPRLQQGVLAVYYLIQQCLPVSPSSEELHLVTRVQCCSLAVGAGRLIIT